MSSGNSNHKPKRYNFPIPLIIRSDSPITITDGKAQLTHKGDIILRIIDTQLIELEPQEFHESLEPISTLFAKEQPSEIRLPEGYVLLKSTKAKRTSYGKEKSVYEYYKRERDTSYIILVKRKEKTRIFNLGSLFDSNSTMSIALKEFSREKPFYRRDLKIHLMPSSLKQGQLIKACLDILTHEGFLDRTEVTIGKHRKVDRYIRTAKQLP